MNVKTVNYLRERYIKLFESTGRLDLVKQKAYSNLGEFSGLCCDDETKKAELCVRTKLVTITMKWRQSGEKILE